MNVTFHTLASLATVAILSRKIKPSAPFTLPSANESIFLLIGFITGILIHGILDCAPHNYPIASIADIFLSLLLVAIMLFVIKKHYYLLIIVCFVGAIFPDLVDLATAIINKRLGTTLPVVKVFPWHWSIYSGSIYNDSQKVESAIYHLTVIIISLTVCYLLRKDWLKNNQSFRNNF